MPQCVPQLMALSGAGMLVCAVCAVHSMSCCAVLCDAIHVVLCCAVLCCAVLCCACHAVLCCVQ
jgi:hypothetical protein